MNTPLYQRNLFGLLCVAFAILCISRCSRTGTSNAPPQNPSSALTAHSVTLNWNVSTSPVVGYNVYRATQPGGPYTKLNSSPIRETNYADSAVQSGQTYFYVVTAVNGNGVESRFSNKVQASVPSP
jgi:fibronectin type 3 domain-containing protein